MTDQVTSTTVAEGRPFERRVRPPEPMTLPWVVVAPSGVAYVGLHEDEASAWCTALGWPSDEEIAERKRAGWYAAQATVTWKRPNAELTAAPLGAPGARRPVSRPVE